MKKIIKPLISSDRNIGKSLMTELETLSDNEWSMLKQMNDQPIRTLSIDIVEFTVNIKNDETAEQAKDRVLQSLFNIEPHRFGYSRIIVRSYDSESKKLIDQIEL